MSLDGKPTAIGPISLTFKRVDDSTFEIVSQASIGGRKFTELSRLSVSKDGRTLTETKTQTERDVTSSRVDENTGAALKTSTSVLVFSKSSGQ